MTETAPSPLSEAQLEIMEIIWEKGEVMVNEVWEILSERRGLARNTVQTMMVRIEEKGWSKHRAVGRTYLYSAAQPRKATLGRTVKELLDTVFRGSAEDLVTALLENRSLSKGEADRIREMIDKAERRRRKKR